MKRKNSPEGERDNIKGIISLYTFGLTPLYLCTTEYEISLYQL